jgi:hypothetical protein
MTFSYIWPKHSIWLEETQLYELCWLNIILKIKQSYYRLWQALMFPGWVSQISWQTAHEGGKVTSPTHQPPLSPRKYSWYSFLLEVESTPGSRCGRKNLCQWKIPVTPSGIEPATFRLVAHCATACPRKHTSTRLNTLFVIYLHNTGRYILWHYSPYCA